MNEGHRELLKQIGKLADDGLFGDSVKEARQEYKNLPSAVAIMIRVANDFVKETAEADEEYARIRDLACQLLIVAYREANKVDPTVAATLVNSFVQDYPGAPKSCLLPRWTALLQASQAARALIPVENKILAWQMTCKHFQAYNEFFDGLLGYLLNLWRAAKNKRTSPGVFDMAYGAKVNAFSDLTGGEDGAFYLFCRMAQPVVRNAIAHEAIWFDDENSVVRYEAGRPKVTGEMDVVEFVGLAHAGSHIGAAYLGAVGLIAAVDVGGDAVKPFLSERLVRLLERS